MSKIETMFKNRTTLLLLMIAVITAAIATIPGTAILLPVQAQDTQGDEDQSGDSDDQDGADQGDQGNNDDSDG